MDQDLERRMMNRATANAWANCYDHVIRLQEQIEWLEDKIAAIQYTNLRRDMNIKNRTKTIDAICKEQK